jgi:hypothetical protein
MWVEANYTVLKVARMSLYKLMMWVHQTSSNMSRLAFHANQPMLLKLMSAITGLLADVPVFLPPRVDYYRACVGVTSSIITS